MTILLEKTVCYGWLLTSSSVMKPTMKENQTEIYISDLRDEITITQETSRESKFGYTGVTSTCVTISKLNLG